MKSCVFLTVAVTALSAPGQEPGRGDRRPLREARSANGRFVLEILPARPGSGVQRRCAAKLTQSSERGGRGRTLWETALVNDVAPARALVRNDGRFVVTLDEFRVGGARNALVIYGQKGRLLRHFILTDLLGGDDWRKVRTRRRSIDWLRGARTGFDDDANQFVIALAWGSVIRIDLKTLHIIRGAAEKDAAAEETGLPLEIMAALFGEDDENQRATSLGEMSERTGMSVAELEKLAALGYLNLDEMKAEKESGVPPGAPEAGEKTAEVSQSERPRIEAESAAVDHSSANASAARVDAGIPVPQPDPANPIDYLQWLNETTRTDGVNAGPAYQAAVDSAVAWDGDPELLTAASRGDSQALASPEIREWVDANREALRHYRDATQLEFQGFELKSADGSMMGALLPSLSPLRGLTVAALTDGKLLESEGRLAEAADVYLDALAAGGHTGSGPTLIENLVGQSMQRQAGHAVMDLVAGAAGGDLDFDDLARRVDESYVPPRSIPEAVQFERSVFLDTLQRVFEPDPTDGDYRVNIEQVKQFATHLSDADLESTAYLERLKTLRFEDTVTEVNAFYDAVTEAASLPYQEGRDLFREIAKAVAHEQANPLLKMLAPDLGRVHFSAARSEANRRATSLVTNVMAYRQKYGEFPASLDVFAGREFVNDPFGNGSFVYRREGDSFVLYSLGKNGRDDQGVHDARAEENDLVFWPRPQ